jgi:hypothetical protein
MVWPQWLERHTFDTLTTMVYAQNPRWIAESCRKTLDLVAGRVPYVPTLSLYPEVGAAGVPKDPEQVIEEVEAVRSLGVTGLYLFMGGQLSPALGPAGQDNFRCLRQGLFRSSAQ